MPFFPIPRTMFFASAMSLPILAALPAVGQAINEDLKLTASDAAAGDRFGVSTAIANGVIAVGA